MTDLRFGFLLDINAISERLLDGGIPKFSRIDDFSLLNCL